MTLVLDLPGPDGAAPRVLAQLVSAALYEGLLTVEAEGAQARDGRRTVRLGAAGLVIDAELYTGAFGRPRVVPGTVRLNGLPAPADAAATIIAALVPEPVRRTRLQDEFARTASGLAHAIRVAPANRRDLDFTRLDSAIYEGHPYHPAFRGRLGFNDADDMRFGPEAKAGFQLRWLLVRDDRLHRSGPDLRGPDGWAQLAGPMVAAMALDRVGAEAAAQWQLMPVHPWQWRAKTAAIVAPAIALGEVHDLGVAGESYRATQSLRTLVNLDRPDAPHLKLPLAVVNTSVARTLDPHWALAGPAISDWLATLVANDRWLSEGDRLLVLKETRALVFDRNGTEAEHTAAIWRDNPAANLAPGEEAVPLNALFAVEADGDPFVAPWIRRYGCTGFVTQLIEVVVRPLVHLLLAYGLASEAHGQNLVLIHRDGWPVRIALRDFSDNLEWVQDFLRGAPPLPDFTAIDPLFADRTPNRFYWMQDVEELRWLFTDAVLIFSLADFAFLMERRYGHTQKAFFDQILCLVTNHAKALKLEHRADRLGLHARTVVTDRLLSAKLGHAAEGPLVVPNSLARKPWEALA